MLTTDILGVLHTYELSALPKVSAAKGSSEPSFEPSSEQGSNPTLVFIHGWLLSRAYWQPLVSQLSMHYRCLTYDLRGFGQSTQASQSAQSTLLSATTTENLNENERTILPPDHGGSLIATPLNVSAYSLAAYAQDLGELLDRLELDNVWLLGHSLGGSIALWSAYLMPERVKGVICINAGGGIYLPNEFEKFRAAGQKMVRFRPAWLRQVPLLPRLFSRLMVNQPLGLKWGKQRIQDFMQADKQAAEGALLASTTREEVHLLPQVVGLLTQPVHFITASQDQVMLPRYVRYLASFHPRFEQESLVSELSDCGHMAMVEQPEAVAEVVRSVLAQSNLAQSDLSG